MAVIPNDWLPNCSMKRIICHWTAGAYKASGLDKAHYHILIEDDGKLVRGDLSILDNVSTADGKYAAHTGGLNTGSIGVSLCCMGGASESPFRPGRFPLTQTQWNQMIRVVAELCTKYNIPVTPRTVLGHGEVHHTLGINQNGKWDPLVLPWNTRMGKSDVGAFLRAQVTIALTPEPEEAAPLPIKARILGQTFDAIIDDDTSYVWIRPVADKLGWRIVRVADNEVTLDVNGSQPILNLVVKEGKGFVSCRELALELNRAIGWDSLTRTVIVG